MPVVIKIHRKIADPWVTFEYAPRTALKHALAFGDLIGGERKLYETGINAYDVSKRVKKFLDGLNDLYTYRVEREHIETVVTPAYSRITHGRIPPKY